MLAINKIPRQYWDITKLKYKFKHIRADSVTTVPASSISHADDLFSFQKNLTDIFKLMNIFKDYSSMSGLSADPKKTKICKINGSISIEEKAQLIEFGLNHSAFVDSYRFLAHKIDFWNLSYSEIYLKQLESKLTKETYLGITRADRALYLT